MNALVLIRFFIGFLFVISGTEKLIAPYQNFLYVIQGYDLLHHPLDVWAARIFPWLELILGIFAILGLWTKWALRGLLALTTTFLLVVGQAILRNLPIEECGCFGGMVSIPLHVILLLDSVLWTYIAYLIIRFERTSQFSVDECF